MNSIAPFWDGNETWLILGGGGIFAAFSGSICHINASPLFTGNIYVIRANLSRGWHFEFRFKSSEEHRKIWDVAFHAGSLLAAFMQGVILGTLSKA